MTTKHLLHTLHFLLILVFLNYQQACTQNTRVKVKNNKASYNYSGKDGRTSFSYKGKIALSDDEKSIQSISPNGFLEYKVGKKSLYITSGSKGALSYIYKVNGREQAFEPEGKAFLASAVQDMINHGIGAEARVQRLYSQGGTNQVLGAIDKLKSDFVKSKYFKLLFTQQGLSSQAVAKSLEKVGTFMNSDFEISKTLKNTPDNFLKDENVSEAYLKSVKTMSSDFEKSKALKYLVANSNSSQILQNSILATQNISSDFEQAKVLKAILSQPNLDNNHINYVLEASKKLSSDFESAKVLTYVLGKTQMNQENFTNFLNASDGISSDFEKSKVFMSALSKEKLNQEGFKGLLDRVTKMSSDFEKSKVMVAIARQLPEGNDQLREAYFKSAKSISSDFEYGKVMRAYQE